jgi:hypothetical protein
VQQRNTAALRHEAVGIHLGPVTLRRQYPALPTSACKLRSDPAPIRACTVAV